MRKCIAAIVTAMFTLAAASAAASRYEDPSPSDPFEKKWGNVEWKEQVKPEETIWYRQLTFKNIYVRNCYVVIENGKPHTFYRYEGFHEAQPMDIMKWKIKSNGHTSSTELVSVDFGVWKDYLDACGMPVDMEPYFAPKELGGQE